MAQKMRFLTWSNDCPQFHLEQPAHKTAPVFRFPCVAPEPVLANDCPQCKKLKAKNHRDAMRFRSHRISRAAPLASSISSRTFHASSQSSASSIAPPPLLIHVAPRAVACCGKSKRAPLVSLPPSQIIVFHQKKKRGAVFFHTSRQSLPVTPETRPALTHVR
jgi:hypothetical protein